MRIAITVFIALLLGIGTGIGTANLRLRNSAWDGNPASRGSQRSIGTHEQGQASGKIQVSELEYDFGTMDMEADGSHDFVITNVGDGLLEISSGETSCKCTLSEIEHSELEPGESTTLAVTWHADGRVGPYRQTATIFTNDPEQPRITLTVSGKMTQAVRTVPRELVFSQLAVGESASGHVDLFCNLDAPLEVLSWELSEPGDAPFFDVEANPLPAEELASDPETKSGVRVGVFVKPGLPQGAFRQKIVLRTNLKEVPEITIPIRGTLAGDIAIVAVGSGWDADQNLLAMGTIEAAKGARRQLLLVVRGQYRDGLTFEPVRVFPNWLSVTVGEASQIGGGTVNQTPLWIEVPKDAPPAVHLGSDQGELGEVRLKTNHPKVPELRIRLRFAVEGQ